MHKGELANINPPRITTEPKQRGVAVRTQFTLPVKFRLVVDEAKKDNTPLQNRKK